MDISVIKASETNTVTGLKVGSDDAQIKIVEFINARCPYCKMWYDKTNDLLTDYVAEGKVQRVIKLFDKEKASLQRGNVMHHYLDYQKPTASYMKLGEIFQTQDAWGNLSLEEVAQFAEDKLGLTKQNNQQVAEKVIQEAAAANITLVPTVILNEHIFDENVSLEDLKNWLDN